MRQFILTESQEEGFTFSFGERETLQKKRVKIKERKKTIASREKGAIHLVEKNPDGERKKLNP